MINFKSFTLKTFDLDYTYPRVKSSVRKLAETYSTRSIINEVDIIMPTFNRVRETRRIIKNLYRSTAVKFNLIIVDNNSGQQMRSFLQKLSRKHSNIQLVLLDKNLGGSGSRNEGLKHIKNKYVAFLDNDIYIMPYYFENLIQTLEEDSNIAAVQSKVITPNELIQINRPFYTVDGKWIIFDDKDFEKKFDDESTFRNEVCNWTPSGATIWRSEVFKNNSFDTTLGTFYEDNEFSFSLSKQGYKFKNNYKAMCIHYSSNFAPEDVTVSNYEKERFNRDAILNALRTFYKKHKLYLAYRDIEGHCQYLGFSNSEEYINFLTSK